VAEIFGEGLAGDLGQCSGEFDSGGAAADHDNVDLFVLAAADRFALGCLEGE
jgi:hypothetical protein